MSRCGEGRNSQVPVLQLHVVSDSDLEGASDRFSNRAESARVYLECTMAALCNSTWNGTRSLCLLTFIGHTLPWATQKELMLAAKNGNIVTEENLFLVALISNESPSKGKLGGINTTCVCDSISLFSGRMFHSYAQRPHLGKQLSCSERIGY